LIFFTYLYYPTVAGIKVDPQKSILIPTAHDEPPIYLNMFKAFFNTPAAILYNTESEKRFVNKLFNNSSIYSDVVGIGVETSNNFQQQNIEHIISNSDDFLIYIGRIDISKGCKMLFEYFLAYKEVIRSDVKLVMVGEVFMDVPVNKDIILTGFVDEDIKISLLLAARALVIPSLYESLSLVTLESMAYGVPVIANKKCEVLKDHIQNSHAGFLFDDYDSFQAALNVVLATDFDKTDLSNNGKKYVAENYSWDVTIKKYQNAIDYVSRH
jgi:glycosyltransferase involved in cell wall biosynthesis